ncbi:MAG: M48 family metalloprotease [SAR86 cluster bacterium]|nr:M48 family metalloprotease [SAR86 cluster bacterium]
MTLRLLLVFSLLTSCSINPVTGNRDFVTMSEDSEIAMGQNYSVQVLQQVPAYKDKDLQAYVQMIGESLAKKSHRSNLIYRFTVLDSPDINAFALPGGYIFINRGLMAYLSSEEELAAVLGHELGHVTARHSVRQMSQAQLIGFMSMIVGSQAGRTAADITNMAGGAFLAGYGREMELEADKIGAEYMALDGYSPQGMMETLTVLKEQEIYSKNLSELRGQEPKTYHGLFSSHPSNDKRLQAVLISSQNLPIVSKKIKSNYLESIDGLVYGDSENAGIRRGSDFYHGPLNFHLKAPASWEILNSQDRLGFLAPKSQASLFFTMEDQNRRLSAKEYLERNKAFDIISGQNISPDGLDAFTAIASSGNSLYRLAVIFRDKNIYQFYGSVEQGSKFSDFDEQFLSIINSFRSLRNKEKLLAKPLKISSYVVKNGDSYSTLSKSSAIPYDPEGRLRLLNGDYPEGELSVGSLIKIIE